MALPDGDGFPFCHTFGKTLRGKDANTFMFCPVTNLSLYVNLCDLKFIDLRDGRLFRSPPRKAPFRANRFSGQQFLIAY